METDMGACVKLFLWSAMNWLNIWMFNLLCVHGDARAHTCMDTHGASSSRLRSLPIVTPPICHQPAESITSDKSVGLQGSLSISISPPQFHSFHTIQYLSVAPPSHNSLLPRNCITFKITKTSSSPSSFPFSVVLSSYFYALLKNSPTCSNLPMTPLFRLHLTFLWLVTSICWPAFQHCCYTSLPSRRLSFFFQHHLAAAARSHQLCLCTWVTTASPLLCCILLLLILPTSSSFLFTLCATLLFLKNGVFTSSCFKAPFCVHEYWLLTTDELITWSERKQSALFLLFVLPYPSFPLWELHCFCFILDGESLSENYL